MTIRPLAFFVALTCGGFLCLTEKPAYSGMENLISLGDINTSPIKKLAVGPGTSLSSSAFFAATDTEHGTELWRYNGGSATLWKDVRPGPESGNPTQINGGSYAMDVEPRYPMAACLWRSIHPSAQSAASYAFSPLTDRRSVGASQVPD